MWDLLKAFYLALGAGVAVYLLSIVLRSKQRLDRRIEEFREEQEQNPTQDPYRALAELYAEEEQRHQEAQKKRRR